MTYCIYTDSEVPEHAGNFDHIIPLALGGSDRFTIWSDKSYNSDMGSQVDGRIANDPLIMLARRNADARGHGDKPPIPVWKKTTFDGRPVQLTLGNEKIELWDARERRMLDEAEWAGQAVETTLRIDRGPPLKFAAKVALAGGFFVYGDLFRDNFDCDELRSILNVDIADQEAVRRSAGKAQLMDRWHPDALSGGSAAHFKHMSEVSGRTTVIFVPHDNGLSVHIGVVGAYLASIVIEGDGTGFPSEGDHDLGHVILLHPGDMETMSFREHTRWSLDALGMASDADPDDGEPAP